MSIPQDQAIGVGQRLRRGVGGEGSVESGAVSPSPVVDGPAEGLAEEAEAARLRLRVRGRVVGGGGGRGGGGSPSRPVHRGCTLGA